VSEAVKTAAGLRRDHPVFDFLARPSGCNTRGKTKPRRTSMTDYELDLLYAESLNGGTPLTDFEEVAVWVRGILTPSNTEASR